jgi:Tudor domain
MTLQVALLDYGIEDELTAADLVSIPESFVAPPCFALSCHLAEIMPAGDITKWSRTACEMLSSLLVVQRKCYVVPKVCYFVVC